MTEVIETVWIPMPDGVKLAARLWLPEGARENLSPAFWNIFPIDVVTGPACGTRPRTCFSLMPAMPPSGSTSVAAATAKV